MMKTKMGNQGSWKRWVALVVCLFGIAAAQGQTPAVVADRSAYLAGEDLTVSFRDGPGNSKDWVGVYPEGVVPGSVGSTRWLYVDGTQQGARGVREGVLMFAGGLNLAGSWDIHFLLNDGYTILASTRVTVLDPGSPRLAVDRRVYTVGEPITLTFTNGPANPKDWIGIYRQGQTPGGPTSTLWRYVDGTTTGSTGRGDGSVSFASGLTAAGDYVAFFLLDDGYDVLASETFSVIPAAGAPPRVLSVTPGDGSVNQSPVGPYHAVLTNGTSRIVAASIELRLNDAPVTPVVESQGERVSVSHTNQTLLASGSTNRFTLVFADESTPPRRFTNEVRFVVGSYRDIRLPAPIVIETFDATTEGQLPTGWTDVTYTDVQNAEEDLGNLDSASFARWTVVAADRFKGSFVTYSNPDNPDGWETDYQRVLTVNPLNVVNGRVYDQPLASGRFVFGNSGYRNGRGQVLYLFSPDYDLRGKADVHVSFHSLWEQNQDSVAAVEYSIDGGASWLPVAYYLDGADIITVTNDVTGATSVDAVATLSTERSDIARYTDPVSGQDKGGTYGAFIGAEVSEALAAFIEARGNDDTVGAKRVELYRLPRADGQAKVRLRFAHAGTDSWYFGLDDVGLYSIPSTPSEPPKLTITLAGNRITISWPASAAGYVLEESVSLSAPTWTKVSGVSGSTVTVDVAGFSRYYRLRR